MTEPNKTYLDSISEAVSLKRDDPLDALNAALLKQSPWFNGHNTAGMRDTPNLGDTGYASSGRWDSKQEQQLELIAFKKLYTKVRIDNLALTHEAAIELVKMIQREADQITYEDTQ